MMAVNMGQAGPGVPGGLPWVTRNGSADGRRVAK